MSISFYVPNAALWWYFYDLYGELLLPRVDAYLPSAAQLPLFVLKAPLAALGGFTTALFTNVLDTVRVRVQTQNTRLLPTVSTLWREERLRMFTLGLSSRLAYSTPFSFFIMCTHCTTHLPLPLELRTIRLATSTFFRLECDYSIFLVRIFSVIAIFLL